MKLVSRSARVAMVRRAKDWFSKNVPTNKEAIGESVLGLFDMGMQIMDEQVRGGEGEAVTEQSVG